MALNPIEFQRGLPLHEFMRDFGSEQQCEPSLGQSALAARLALRALWWHAQLSHPKRFGQALVGVLHLRLSVLLHRGHDL